MASDAAPPRPGASTGAESVFDAASLARYADAIVRTCLDLAPGDRVIVHGEPAHRRLVVALAESAYRAGARIVEPWYTDPLVRRARLLHGSDESLGVVPPWDIARYRGCVGPDAALISITGEETPNLLADVPPERSTEDLQRRAARLRWFMRAQSEERVRFCIAAWPTPSWARQVYPELEPDEAERRLATDLLWFCRLSPEDGPDAWPAHVALLEERAALLGERDLRRLELRGPGTTLDVGLAPGTRFLSAVEENAYGQRPCVNFPSEEVFTSPVAAATEGTFRCSRPLTFSGRTIEGIAGEFRRGRLARLEAARDQDRELLSGYLSTDRGAGRLGEVALVDGRSRIGQTGRTYGDTLLDENAATHIAFGFGFQASRANGDRDAVRSVNRSKIHLDVMIGSDELDITGVAEDGTRVPVIVDGEWRLGWRCSPIRGIARPRPSRPAER